MRVQANHRERERPEKVVGENLLKAALVEVMTVVKTR